MTEFSADLHRYTGLPVYDHGLTIGLDSIAVPTNNGKTIGLNKFLEQNIPIINSADVPLHYLDALKYIYNLTSHSKEIPILSEDERIYLGELQLAAASGIGRTVEAVIEMLTDLTHREQGFSDITFKRMMYSINISPQTIFSAVDFLEGAGFFSYRGERLDSSLSKYNSGMRSIFRELTSHRSTYNYGVQSLINAVGTNSSLFSWYASNGKTDRQKVLYHNISRLFDSLITSCVSAGFMADPDQVDRGAIYRSDSSGVLSKDATLTDNLMSYYNFFINSMAYNGIYTSYIPNTKAPSPHYALDGTSPNRIQINGSYLLNGIQFYNIEEMIAQRDTVLSELKKMLTSTS